MKGINLGRATTEQLLVRKAAPYEAGRYHHEVQLVGVCADPAPRQITAEVCPSQ
jgi:hypothetical protein